jgi:hypothetical protein
LSPIMDCILCPINWSGTWHLPLSNLVCRRWKSSTIYIRTMFFFPLMSAWVLLWFMCGRVSGFVSGDQRFWFNFVSSFFFYETDNRKQ